MGLTNGDPHQTPALTPHARTAGHDNPPSISIRSRFNDMLMQHTAAPRGHKRRLGDVAPSTVQPLRFHSERDESAFRPRQLFDTTGALFSPTASPASTGESPARRVLSSVRRESLNVAQIEALKRSADKARTEVHSAELKMAALEADAARVKAALEAEVQAQSRRVEKLERDRRWLFEQEERLAEEKRESEKRANAIREKLERRIDELERAVSEKESGLGELARKSRRERSTLEAKIEELECALAREKRLNIEASAVRAPETPIALIHEKKESEPLDSLSNTRIVSQLERELHAQCVRIKELDSLNEKLRANAERANSRAAEAERLREVNRTLEAKVARLGAISESHADLEAQLTVMQQDRDQWRKVFHGSSQNDSAATESPYAVASIVTTQKARIKMLTDRVADLEDQVKTRSEDFERVSQDASRSREDKARIESELADEQRKRVVAERASQYARRECEFLRAQIRAYDMEETNLAGRCAKDSRIEQLELFVDEQSAFIGSLQGAKADAAQNGNIPHVTSALLKEYREAAERKGTELDAARTQLEELQRRLEETEREAARLEHQVGSGLGYNPRTTRILQLKDNPSARDYAIRTEKLSALVAENESLLAHIKTLEGNQQQQQQQPQDATHEDSPFFHTIENLRDENQNLTKQLEDSGKLMKRYKKEWKRKAAELRDVVYLILGFRVDFLANGGVRFTSMYARDIDQSFIFTSGDGDRGVMRLTGGGSKVYLKGLANDIRYWVQERGSIPGFLATVTLQNFEASQCEPVE